MEGRDIRYKLHADTKQRNYTKKRYANLYNQRILTIFVPELIILSVYRRYLCYEIIVRTNLRIRTSHTLCAEIERAESLGTLHTDSPCGIKEVDIAINYAVEEKDDTYQDLLTRLSAKQKALLIALARSGKNVQPTSGDFIKRYHLSSASAVQRSLSSLQEKDIITNDNGKYYIYDYFLYYWLTRK